MENNNIIIPKDDYDNLLEEFNSVICACKDGYLWRELSSLDLKLRKYIK